MMPVSPETEAGASVVICRAVAHLMVAKLVREGLCSCCRARDKGNWTVNPCVAHAQLLVQSSESECAKPWQFVLQGIQFRLQLIRTKDCGCPRRSRRRMTTART